MPLPRRLVLKAASFLHPHPAHGHGNCIRHRHAISHSHTRTLHRTPSSPSSPWKSMATPLTGNPILRCSYHFPSSRLLPPLLCPEIQSRGFLGVGDGDEDSGDSKHYEEIRTLGYSPEKLFDVVAAVDLYEDYIPWCQKSRVIWRKGEEALDAELEIGFKFFVESYISHVELKRPSLVKTSVSESNLFEYLINIWEFKEGPVPDSCRIHFYVDFKFRSPLYRHVANMFFNEVVARLVSSFESRCSTVYGPGTKILESSYGSATAER